jgi:Domain of unknown function (DUF4307)
VSETARTSDPTFVPPENRYGPGPRPHRRIAMFVAVGALAVAGLAWVLWAAFSYAYPPIRATLVSYTVTDTTVTVKFQIVKNAEYPATCTVRARNREGAEVGSRDVTIPAGVRTDTLTEELTTTGKPVTGEVRDCRLVR